MIEVRWSPDALADLDRIDAFNLAWSEDWALRVRRRIEARCDTLGLLPRQGRPVGRGLRLLSIPDIQYVVFYDAAADTVTINRLFHTHENREER